MTVRTDGRSAGRYAKCNLGTHVGDEADAVAANRRALAVNLGVDHIAWLNQVHGRDVVRADKVTRHVATADASVTRAAATACAVMVADCVPVLLAALDGTAVGAAHAGWRGLADGVINATLTAMAMPAAAITAWVGPAIGRAHYEVGGEVRAAFDGADGACFSASRPGHCRLDLKALAEAQLRRAGVSRVTVAPYCVYERADLFYSYRRDGVTGRCAALIWRTRAQ